MTMPSPADPTLANRLAEHLAVWLANTPPCTGARELADAMLDPGRRGPLVDHEYVTGLVALLDRLKRWPSQNTEVPERAGRVLQIVKHPQRPPLHRGDPT